MNNTFGGIYKGKRVLVTGHTGFKGSWLSLWLTKLGAEVAGYSAYIPSRPSNYEACGIRKMIRHIDGNILDNSKLYDSFRKFKPEIVFHLAAQPIIKRSYDDPKLTFDTNIGGTVNVLECIRKTRSVKAAVIITSDKCYRNVEWEWGYRENDVLGGEDPYSASKAGAELVINSYIKSYFNNNRAAAVSSVRAGNVIGGGDWAEGRIIPDCVRAWAHNKTAIVRNPDSTRPWQHVLEPLSGYLLVGLELMKTGRISGESFNFGPDQKINKTVKELLSVFGKFWKQAKWKHVPERTKQKENKLLKLSCDKALHMLNWHAVLSFVETVELTAKWYSEYYRNKQNMNNYELGQIEYYEKEAAKQKLIWTKGK